MKFTNERREIEFNDSLKLFYFILTNFERKLHDFEFELEQRLSYPAEPVSLIRNMEPVLNDFIMKLIGSLANFGFYDITAEDYLDTNQGYLDLLNAVNQYYDFANAVDQEHISAAQRRINQIGAEEESHITGLSFGIISSSITAHILYGIQNDGAIRKQTDEARANYERRSNAILKDMENSVARKCKEYYNTIFSTNCHTALKNFIACIFSRYIIDLDKCGQIDKNCISGIDIDRSYSLLKNVEVVPDTHELLYTAIEKCPYNLKIYEVAIHTGYINEMMCDVAHWLSLDKYIVEQIVHELETCSYELKEKLLQISAYLVNSKMLSNDLIQIYKKRLDSIISYYYKLIDEHPFDINISTCKDSISHAVYHIILESELQFFTELFGSTHTLESLADKIKSSNTNYQDLMNDYCNAIYEILEAEHYAAIELNEKNRIAKEAAAERQQKEQKAILDRQQKAKEACLLREQEEHLLNQKKIENFKRKLKKTFIITIALIITILICGLITIFIVDKSRYDKAVEAYNNEDYALALSYFDKSIFTDTEDYKIKTYTMLGTTTDDPTICEEMYNKVATDEQKQDIIFHQIDLYYNMGDTDTALSIIRDKKDEIPELDDLYWSFQIEIAKEKIENQEYKAAFAQLAGFIDSTNPDYIETMDKICAGLITDMNIKYEPQYFLKVSNDYYDRENLQYWNWCRWAYSYIDNIVDYGSTCYSDVEKAKAYLNNVPDGFELKTKIVQFVDTVESINGTYRYSGFDWYDVKAVVDFDGNVYVMIGYNKTDLHPYNSTISIDGNSYEFSGSNLLITKNGKTYTYTKEN